MWKLADTKCPRPPILALNPQTKEKTGTIQFLYGKHLLIVLGTASPISPCLTHIFQPVNNSLGASSCLHVLPGGLSSPARVIYLFFYHLIHHNKPVSAPSLPEPLPFTVWGLDVAFDIPTGCCPGAVWATAAFRGTQREGLPPGWVLQGSRVKMHIFPSPHLQISQ